MFVAVLGDEEVAEVSYGGHNHSRPALYEKSISEVEKPWRITVTAVEGSWADPERVSPVSSARGGRVARQLPRSIPRQDPDLVVFNAKVYTVDPLGPRAQAFAIKAGRFVAVGSTEAVKTLIGKQTQTFDAKQMTVVPGFIDAHNHAPGAILLYEVLVGNPYEVEFVTIASIVDKLRAKARETPRGVLGRGILLRRHQSEGQARPQHSRP